MHLHLSLKKLSDYLCGFVFKGKNNVDFSQEVCILFALITLVLTKNIIFNTT